MTGYLDALARAAALAGGDPGDTEASLSAVPAFPRPRPRFEPAWDEPETPAWPDLEEVVEPETLRLDAVRGTVVAGAGAPAAMREPERPEADAATHPDRAQSAYTAQAGPGWRDRTVNPTAHVGPSSSDPAEDAHSTLPQPPAGTARSVPDEPAIGRTPQAEPALQPTETISVTQPESSWGPSAEAADRPVAGRSDATAQRTVTPALADQDAGEPALWARAEAHPAAAPPLAAEVTAAADERPTDEARQPVVIEIGRIEVRITADPPSPPRRERPPRPRTGPTLAEYLGLPGAGGR
ncbi:hypothetical protein [Micromonospora chersina]|uniref:hypothetical protein n=1 Tax=Micromonospora chersina TaxID=47854 RepID=UPI0037224839